MRVDEGRNRMLFFTYQPPSRHAVYKGILIRPHPFGMNKMVIEKEKPRTHEENGALQGNSRVPMPQSHGHDSRLRSSENSSNRCPFCLRRKPRSAAR